MLIQDTVQLQMSINENKHTFVYSYDSNFTQFANRFKHFLVENSDTRQK